MAQAKVVDLRPPCGRRTRALLLALGCLLLVPGAAHAATVMLDTSLAGAHFDAILDGFPGLAPNDGVGDLPGNALAVSLKTGVTEERAFVELPLATLVAAGGTSTNVVEGTLTFNIDDVLSTFGPGTDFDGTAGERILVSTYAGDGTVDFDDYARGVLAATVQTGPQGSITDASLRSSGPITFTVDVTERVKSLLAQNATHIGISFATDDSPTGASIDNLGDGGVGPPGVGGATLPFLTVKTADATPTPTNSPSPTNTPPASPSPTASPSPVPTPPPGPTPSVGATPTPVPTATSDPGVTPTPPVATVTPPRTSGATPTPAQVTPQPTLAPTPSAGATATATTPTPGTTATPAASRTPVPSAAPTATLDPRLTPTPRPIVTPSPRATATPGSTATPAPTGAATEPALTRAPDGSGDQLIFYYDAHDSFTTFLNLHNLGDDAVDVRLVLYDTALAQPFAENLALAGGATRTIDLGVLRGEGLPARAGAAFATAVDASGVARVTRALAGSFTVANLATGSAWGAPAAARRAVAIDGGASRTPAIGEAIDGSTVRLRALRPDQLGLAVFYDPQTLEPAELGGNQLVLLSFADVEGVVPSASATTWSLDARRSDGQRLTADTVVADGVLATHLEALLGPAANGAAGSVTFTTEGGTQNRLVFFSESLGTFATGYLLPPLAP